MGYQEVIKKVDEKRKKLGWSQETTARYFNVSLFTYQRWVKGVHKPIPVLLEKLVDFLESEKS